MSFFIFRNCNYFAKYTFIVITKNNISEQTSISNVIKIVNVVLWEKWSVKLMGQNEGWNSIYTQLGAETHHTNLNLTMLSALAIVPPKTLWRKCSIFNEVKLCLGLISVFIYEHIFKCLVSHKMVRLTHLLELSRFLSLFISKYKNTGFQNIL